MENDGENGGENEEHNDEQNGKGNDEGNGKDVTGADEKSGSEDVNPPNPIASSSDPDEDSN